MKQILFLSLIAIILFSCNSNEIEYYKLKGNTQGTTYSLIYQGNDTLVRVSEIDSVLHKFDMSLSTYIPESVISRINSGDTNVVADKFFTDMYNKSYEIYEASNGAFDITVSPLVNAYGFGYKGDTLNVSKKMIDSILVFVGMNKTSLKNNKIHRKFIQTKFDSNAIAQGQSVDVVCNFLESKGINDYLVEIGGELRAKGLKFGQKWHVGIDKPVDNAISGKEFQAILEFSDKALATSGNYRKFYIKDGKRYSHSINPKTGYPSYQNILSATIITDKCIDADSYATACMVLGLEKSKELIANHPDLEAYFIYSDENNEMKTYASKGFQKYISKK